MAYYTTTNYGTYTISYNTTSSATWNNSYKWTWRDPDKDKENEDLLHHLNTHDPFETEYERNQRTRNRPQLWA